MAILTVDKSPIRELGKSDVLINADIFSADESEFDINSGWIGIDTQGAFNISAGNLTTSSGNYLSGKYRSNLFDLLDNQVQIVFDVDSFNTNKYTDIILRLETDLEVIYSKTYSEGDSSGVVNETINITKDYQDCYFSIEFVPQTTSYPDVTTNMSLDATWNVVGSAYTDLSEETEASGKITATFNNTDAGIITESGGTAYGLCLYIFNGVLYFQCGEGGGLGSINTAEIYYIIPSSTDSTYTIEWSASVSNQKAALYINGILIGVDNFNATYISGNDEGTIGESEVDVCVNRGGWVGDQAGVFTGSVASHEIFLGEITDELTEANPSITLNSLQLTNIFFKRITSNAVASDNPIRWEFSGAGETLNVNTFDISTSVFNQDFTLSSPQPTGIAFNNDGSKMFTVGSNLDNVKEYDLSTNYDISTSELNQSFNVSNEDIQPTSIVFNNDGSKMYISGDVSNSILEYDLSSNFDISTTVFNQSFNVNTQQSNVQALAFNNDGSKMYIAGYSPSSVHEYDLSSNFDISTSVFNQSFSFSNEDLGANGLSFNNDGSKMYMIGSDSDSVYEYDLSIFYDISTSVLNGSFDISNKETFPRGMNFNNIGSKMYIVGGSKSYEYNIGATELFPSDYVEFNIKQYTNTDSTIQTVSTLKQKPNTDGTLSLDISPIIKNYTDLILPTTDQETQDTYFARVEYEIYLNGVGQGSQTLPDIQVIQAAKQIGDEFGQNMGRYVIQDTAIAGLYNFPITMEKPCIYNEYPYYLTSYFKNIDEYNYNYEIDFLDENNTAIQTLVEDIDINNSISSNFSLICRGLYVEGNNMYVCQQTIYLYDISNGLDSALLIDEIDVSSFTFTPMDAQIKGNTMYICGGNNLIQSIDITDFSNPTLIDSLDVGAPAYDLFIKNDTLYVIFGAILSSYDISLGLSSASLINSVNITAITNKSTYRGVFVDDKYIYLADRNSGLLHQFNNDLSSMSLLSEFYSGLIQESIFLANNKIYIGSESPRVCREFDFQINYKNIKTLQQGKKEHLNINNSSSIKIKVSNNTNTLTKEYLFKYKECFQNPYLLEFENTLGGLDQIMFQGNQENKLKTKLIGEYGDNETDLAIKTTDSYYSGYTNTREVKVGAEIEKENLFGLENLLVSRTVNKLEKDGSRTPVKIKAGSFKTWETENNKFDVELTLILPSYNTIVR